MKTRFLILPPYRMLIRPLQITLLYSETLANDDEYTTHFLKNLIEKHDYN